MNTAAIEERMIAATAAANDIVIRNNKRFTADPGLPKRAARSSTRPGALPRRRRPERTPADFARSLGRRSERGVWFVPKLFPGSLDRFCRLSDTIGDTA